MNLTGDQTAYKTVGLSFENRSIPAFYMGNQTAQKVRKRAQRPLQSDLSLRCVVELSASGTALALGTVTG